MECGFGRVPRLSRRVSSHNCGTFSFLYFENGLILAILRTNKGWVPNPALPKCVRRFFFRLLLS